MGRFKYLVESPALIKVFKEKYHIPQEVSLWYCPPEGIAIDREVVKVIIPMIAFIEGGMSLPMGRVTRDYLRNHRLCPHQCAHNLFRILGAIDTLNQHLGLGLTWLDVVHMYENKKGRGFTLNPDPTLSGSFPVFLSLTRGWRMATWLYQEHGMTVSIAQPSEESQVGYLRFRFPNIRFMLFILGFVLLYIFYVHIFFTMDSKFLTIFSFSLFNRQKPRISSAQFN